jgi:hypothetical protein
MVGCHINAVTALQLPKNKWYPPLNRLRGPPIVSRTSEEKNVNTLWNTKEFCVLHVQSNTTIIYLLVQ